MKTIYKADKKLSKTARRTFQGIALVGLMMAIAPIALSFTATAAVPGEDYAIQSSTGQGLFILGFILLVVLGVLWKTGSYNAGESMFGVVLITATALLLIIPSAIGAAVYFAGPSVGPTFCEENPTHPSCITPQLITWDVQIEADLDAAGATYPKSPMTIVDTAVGGTTGEWVAADNGNVDMHNMLVTTSYTIDTDLDDTDALWAEPNGIFIETTRVQLLSGPRASSGAMETQHYFARIDHISMTKLSTDNESVQYGTFYQDLSGRWHIGYQYEDGSWAEACPEYRGKDLPTSGCAPIPVGTDDGTGDTVGSIASAGFRIWWIWEDRGPIGHNHLDGATWTLTFSIGSESDWHTFTFIMTMTESATNNS